MFGAQFLFTQEYKKEYGNDFLAMVVQSIVGGIVGFVSILIINGFSFGYTHFALVMSLLVFVNSKFCAFCSLKALGKINLTLYSVFMMLGGMVLPFVTGVLFFGEPLTWGKAICFVFIAAAICMTLEKNDNKKGGAIYYIGIFIFNGLSGVLAKVYTALPFEKVDAAEYSVLCSLVNLVLSVALLWFARGVKRKLTGRAVASLVGSGLLNKIANYWLLICLAVVPASAQYPFITGGTMVASALISYCTKQKPNKKELLSVGLSMAGLILLVLIP